MGFLVLVLTKIFVSYVVVGLNLLPVSVFIFLFVFFFSFSISLRFTVCLLAGLVTNSILFCWLFAIHNQCKKCGYMAMVAPVNGEVSHEGGGCFVWGETWLE